MHLYYPYHGGQAQTAATRVQRLFSPPHTHPTSNSRAFFSISYTAAISLPHAVTLIHWMIEVPHHPEPGRPVPPWEVIDQLLIFWLSLSQGHLHEKQN